MINLYIINNNLKHKYSTFVHGGGLLLKTFFLFLKWAILRIVRIFKYHDSIVVDLFYKVIFLPMFQCEPVVLKRLF